MTDDRIVYTLVTRGGGIDGMDHTDKGGQVVFATYDRKQAEAHSSKPWCELVPIVVDVHAGRRTALAKLSPVDKLVLNLKD
jgi:hypothetical protein